MKFSEMTYTRPDMGAIEADMNRLIQAFETAGSASEQVEVLHSINVLRSNFQTLASIASVRNSINTQDAFYEAEQDFFDANEPAIKDLNIKLYKALGQQSV
jgi:oligoendopeptidase F